MFDLAKHTHEKQPWEVSALEALAVKKNLETLCDLISAGVCQDVKVEKLRQHMAEMDTLVGECTALESMLAVVAQVAWSEVAAFPQ